MISINMKSATYAYTTSEFNSGRGMAVAFTRSGDADACIRSGEYKTSELLWASQHQNVDIRNDSAFPIDYDCWYIVPATEDEPEERFDFTGTLAAGESKRITDDKQTGQMMHGIFTAAGIVTVYGAQL